MIIEIITMIIVGIITVILCYYYFMNPHRLERGLEFTVKTIAPVLQPATVQDNGECKCTLT